MDASTRQRAAKPRSTAPPNMPPRRRISEEFEHLSDVVLLTQRQFSELTGYGLATIEYWRKQGRGPKFVSINGRPRVTVAAIKTWLAELPLADE